MRQTVLVVGAEYREALETAVWYLKRGDAVYVGVTNGEAWLAEKLEKEYPGLKAMLIDLGAEETKELTERITREIGKYHDYDDILRVLDYNINGLRQVIENALPLLRQGEKKRIAVITESGSSISWTKETDDFAYHMSLAAIHMMEKLYFNRLRPEGFTFRCYTEEGSGGICGAEYIERGLCYDEKEPYIHSDENRLVMRDRYLHEIPW